MSRSIHRNRSKKQMRGGKSDRVEILVALVGKRRTKRLVRVERRQPSTAAAPASSDNLIISFVDRGPGVFYPATEADLRHVMDSLPRGTLDGLKKVQLELGTAEMSSDRGTHPRYCEDPTYSRPGVQVWPGVYEPSLLGRYESRFGRIRLFAYVFAPGVSLSSAQEARLKLEMLDTLIHELAHHQDRVTRVARGRWLAQSGGKSEAYAKGTATRWSNRYVLPYVLACTGITEAELTAHGSYAV